MEFLPVSIICITIGTLGMMLVYIYLFSLYRERYMGFWILGWLPLLLRAILYDSGMFEWKQSAVGFTIYQMLFISASLIFVYGTHLFVGRPFKKIWLYTALGVSGISFVLTFLHVSLAYRLLPAAWFGGGVCIWVGVTFIHHLEVNKTSKFLTGYAAILWGIITLTMPFVIDIVWIAPWGYLISGILRLIIIIGVIIIYFEKVRSDLAQREAQYRLLTENAVDIIFRYSVSPNIKFDYISPSVLAVTGYSPEEYYADGNLLSTLVYSEDQALMDDVINNSPQRELLVAFRIVHKDKSIVWVEQKRVMLYDMNGNVQAVEGILRDVTARKNFEEVASRVNQMNVVGKMAATVAHEIRNPMTTVRGYLQMLARNKENEKNKGKYELMIQEIDRANEIIREYLSLAKEKVVNLRNCCLNNIVQSLYPLIEADALASKVIIKLELSDIPEIYLDENEIRQLLLNLIRNALESMPDGGVIDVRTFLYNDKVVLTISDQGAGIPAHIVDKLGTPFVTTKDNGTGLGLSMCYRIVNRHNATMDFKTSDEGTIFFIYFNLSPSWT